MTNVINIGITSIDSLKIRIPIWQLNTYDLSLDDTLCTVNKTVGTEGEDFKKRSKEYQCKEYKFYVSINQVKTSLNQIEDCITLLLNSKQLQGHYFEGITLDNVKLIYDQVIELGILDCSLDTFLSSAPTDIDFKKDHNSLDLDEYKELLGGVKAMTKHSSKSEKGYRSHKLGVEWSIRKTNKYLTNPYLKIYHKETELLTNSDDFTRAYLNGIDFKNLFRIETTVKNRKHLRSLNLGLKDYTFKDLLLLSTEKKDSIISNAINSQLDSRTRMTTFKTEQRMTPVNRINLNALLILTSELNWGIDRSVSTLINGIKNESSKSVNKATLYRLYNDHIKGTNYDFKTSKIDSILDSFGWF